MPENVTERIRAFNATRLPAMLAVKYRNMRANAFTFFRGSCHLFYEDWPAASTLNTAPLTWVCGDPHLENFGTYKGLNRLVYFDINDFDEGALAPCTWDLARFTTSLMLAGDVLHIPPDSSSSLCRHFLDTYFSTLAKGHIHSVERADATGLVKKLMRALKSRRRADFLNECSRKHKTGRKFKIENSHYLPPALAERELVMETVSALGAGENNRDFYKVHDVAFRMAGTGSLGVKRYAALIEGRGSPDGNFILDIKEANKSTLEPYLKAPQPAWSSQAARIVSVQKRFQGFPPALLAAVQMGQAAFVIKELQPVEDRINLSGWAGKIEQVKDLAGWMAKILAWGELRSGARSGSAGADELIAFGEAAAAKQDLLTYAQDYALRVNKDFKQFAGAYDDGKLK